MAFWKKVQNIWREAADKAEASISDTGRDVKFAIEDAEKEVRKFTEEIRTVRKHILSMEKQAKELDDSVAKMVRIAQQAAKAGNQADVKSALEEKAIKEKELSFLKTEIENTNTQYHKLLEMKRSREAKIRAAKGNQGMLMARSTNAKLIKKSKEAAAGLGASDALSALDSLASEVDALEAEAAATVELAELNTVPESLAEKYATSGVNVDDEVARLMAEANN